MRNYRRNDTRITYQQRGAQSLQMREVLTECQLVATAPKSERISNIEVEGNKLRTLSARELLENTFVLLRIHDAWRIERNGSIGMLDDGRRPARWERGMEHGWLTTEMRHAARDLALELVPPRQGAHVRYTVIRKIVRVSAGRWRDEEEGRTTRSSQGQSLGLQRRRRRG